MELLVNSSDLKKVKIGATGLTEIAQNVRTILTTIRGTVPLDRSFGVSGNLLDLPLPVAQARFSTEIVQEVEKQEPRVKVLRVQFKEDREGAIEGTLLPIVTIQIREGVL